MSEENKFTMPDYDHQLRIMKGEFAKHSKFREGIGFLCGKAIHLQNLKLEYLEDVNKKYFWNVELFPWTGGDNILFKDEDWHDFWEITKKHFPIYSVAGTGCLTIKEIIKSEYETFDENMFQIPSVNDYGIHTMISKNIDIKPILEIGFGYGGVGTNLLKRKKKYYGIDYVINHAPLRRKPNNFIEIKVSGIPEQLMGLRYGIVYSSNVFQHLTHKQKLDYFNQIGQVLDNDGVFYFDVFEWNYDLNKEITNPTFSTKFFLAETCIETKEEIEEMLSQSALDIIFDNAKKSNLEFRQHQYYCRKRK